MSTTLEGARKAAQTRKLISALSSQGLSANQISEVLRKISNGHSKIRISKDVIRIAKDILGRGQRAVLTVTPKGKVACLSLERYTAVNQNIMKAHEAQKGGANGE